MKNNCNVARDLMPLVIDGVASEESQQYVNDHVAECTECAMTYGAMRVELPRANQEKERAEMEKAAKALKKKRRKRVCWAIVICLVLCYLLLFSGRWLWNQLTMYNRIPLNKSEIAVQLYKTSDGGGLIVYDQARDDVKMGLGWSSDATIGVITLEPQRPIIQLHNEKYEKQYGGYRSAWIGGWEEQGWVRMTKEEVEKENNRIGRENYFIYDPNPIREIWVAYGDGNERIYKHGDEVPTCSTEMEAYFAYLLNPNPASDYGKPVEYDYDKLAELRAAVPEWQ